MSSTIVIGKRKHAAVSEDPLVLHLSSSPSPSRDLRSDSEYESPQAVFDIGTSTVQPTSKPPYQKRFKCAHEGCTKAYSKPSRLAEHERSHTGDVSGVRSNAKFSLCVTRDQRPFVCTTCDKSYLRESHLQAHVRVHLPSSSKPFVCTEDQCNRRFWTAQHLRVHSETHRGEKPFKVST